ncbi:MAG: AgmX/PglI C-terminal domain-containing protein [Myxococcota bacterium]
MRSLPLILLALAFSSSALAQPDVSAARSRATQTIDCLRPLQSELRTTVQLLREARDQMNTSDAEARQDAARAVSALEQRLHRLAERIQSCVPEEASLEPRTVIQERTGSDARVGVENQATSETERGTALTRNVHVEVGERVDGHGSIAAAEVRRMVSRIGSRLDRCYGQLVERGALQTGTAILAFTVTPSGRIRRVTTERVTLGDSRFHRCLRRAGQSIRASTAAMGGDVRFAYTLRFGPQ